MINVNWVIREGSTCICLLYCGRQEIKLYICDPKRFRDFSLANTVNKLWRHRRCGDINKEAVLKIEK